MLPGRGHVSKLWFNLFLIWTLWFVGSQVYSPDGKKRYELKAYEDALGIKTMGTSYLIKAWPIAPCTLALVSGKTQAGDDNIRVVWSHQVDCDGVSDSSCLCCMQRGAPVGAS